MSDKNELSNLDEELKAIQKEAGNSKQERETKEKIVKTLNNAISEVKAKERKNMLDMLTDAVLDKAVKVMVNIDNAYKSKAIDGVETVNKALESFAAENVMTTSDLMKQLETKVSEATKDIVALREKDFSEFSTRKFKGDSIAGKGMIREYFARLNKDLYAAMESEQAKTRELESGIRAMIEINTEYKKRTADEVQELRKAVDGFVNREIKEVKQLRDSHAVLRDKLRNVEETRITEITDYKPASNKINTPEMQNMIRQFEAQQPGKNTESNNLTKDSDSELANAMAMLSDAMNGDQDARKEVAKEFKQAVSTYSKTSEKIDAFFATTNETEKQTVEVEVEKQETAPVKNADYKIAERSIPNFEALLKQQEERVKYRQESIRSTTNEPQIVDDKFVGAINMLADAMNGDRDARTSVSKELKQALSTTTKLGEKLQTFAVEYAERTASNAPKVVFEIGDKSIPNRDILLKQHQERTKYGTDSKRNLVDTKEDFDIVSMLSDAMNGNTQARQEVKQSDLSKITSLIEVTSERAVEIQQQITEEVSTTKEAIEAIKEQEASSNNVIAAVENLPILIGKVETQEEPKQEVQVEVEPVKVEKEAVKEVVEQVASLVEEETKKTEELVSDKPVDVNIVADQTEENKPQEEKPKKPQPEPKHEPPKEEPKVEPVETTNFSRKRKKLTPAMEAVSENEAIREMIANLPRKDKYLLEFLSKRIKGIESKVINTIKESFGDAEKAQVSAEAEEFSKRLRNELVDGLVLNKSKESKERLKKYVMDESDRFINEILKTYGDKIKAGKIVSDISMNPELAPKFQNARETFYAEFANLVSVAEQARGTDSKGEPKGFTKAQQSIVSNIDNLTKENEFSSDVIYGKLNKMTKQKGTAQTMKELGVFDEVIKFVKAIEDMSPKIDPEKAAKTMDSLHKVFNPDVINADVEGFKSKIRSIGSSVVRTIDEISAAEKEIFAISAITNKQGAEISAFRMEMTALAVSLPFTTKELASAYGDLVRTGKTAEEAGVILRSVGDLAVATFESLGHVTSNVNSLVLAMELEAERTTEVSKALFSVLNATPLNFSSLSAALTQTAAAFNSVISQTSKTGEALEDYKMNLTKLQASMIGGMALLGKTGSQSGTAIRNMVTRLQSMEEAAKRAVNADLAKAGGYVTTTGEIISTASDIAAMASEDFMKVTEVLSEMVKRGVLSFDSLRKLFTGRNVTQIVGVLTQIDGNIESFNKRMTEMGDLTKAAELAGDSWINQWQQFTQIMGDAKSILGDVGDSFSFLLKGVNTIASGLFDAMDESTEVKAAVSGLSVFGTTVAGVGLVGSAQAPLLNMMNKALLSTGQDAKSLTEAFILLGKSGLSALFSVGGAITITLGAIAAVGVALHEMDKALKASQAEAKRSALLYIEETNAAKKAHENTTNILNQTMRSVSELITGQEDPLTEFQKEMNNIYYGFDDTRNAINKLGVSLRNFIDLTLKANSEMPLNVVEAAKRDWLKAEEEHGFDSKEAKVGKDTYDAVSIIDKYKLTKEDLISYINDERKVKEGPNTFDDFKSALTERFINKYKYDNQTDLSDNDIKIQVNRILPEHVVKSLYGSLVSGKVDTSIVKSNMAKEAFNDIRGVFTTPVVSEKTKYAINAIEKEVGGKKYLNKFISAYLNYWKAIDVAETQKARELEEAKTNVLSEHQNIMRAIKQKTESAIIKSYKVESKSGAELLAAITEMSNSQDEFIKNAIEPYKQAYEALKKAGKDTRDITYDDIQRYREAQVNIEARKKANRDYAAVFFMEQENPFEGNKYYTNAYEELVKSYENMTGISGNVFNDLSKNASEAMQNLIPKYNAAKDNAKERAKILNEMKIVLASDSKHLSEYIDSFYSTIIKNTSESVKTGVAAFDDLKPKDKEQVANTLAEIDKLRTGNDEGKDLKIKDALSSLESILDEKLYTLICAIVSDKTETTVEALEVLKRTDGIKKVKIPPIETYMQQYSNSLTDTIEGFTSTNLLKSDLRRYGRDTLLNAKGELAGILRQLDGKELGEKEQKTIDEIRTDIINMTEEKDIDEIRKKLEATNLGLDKKEIERIVARIKHNFSATGNIVLNRFFENITAQIEQIKSYADAEAEYSEVPTKALAFLEAEKEFVRQYGNLFGLATEDIKAVIANMEKTQEEMIKSAAEKQRQKQFSKALSEKEYSKVFETISTNSSNIKALEYRRADIDDKIKSGRLSKTEASELKGERDNISNEIMSASTQREQELNTFKENQEGRLGELQQKLHDTIVSAIERGFASPRQLELETEQTALRQSIGQTVGNVFSSITKGENVFGSLSKDIPNLITNLINVSSAKTLEKKLEKINDRIKEISKQQKDIERKRRLADDIQEKVALSNEESALTTELFNLELEKEELSAEAIALEQLDSVNEILSEMNTVNKNLEKIKAAIKNEEEPDDNTNDVDGIVDTIASKNFLSSFFKTDAKGNIDLSSFSIENAKDSLIGLGGDLVNIGVSAAVSKWTDDAALGATVGGISQAAYGVLTLDASSVFKGIGNTLKGVASGLMGDSKKEKEISKKIEEHNEKIRETIEDFNFEVLVAKLESINTGIRMVSENITKYGLIGSYSSYARQVGGNITGAAAAEYVDSTVSYGGSWFRRRRRKDVIAAVSESVDLATIGSWLGGEYAEKLSDYRMDTLDEMRLALQGAKEVQSLIVAWQGENAWKANTKGENAKEWAQSVATSEALAQVIEKIEKVNQLYADNLDKFNSQLFGFTLEFIDEFGNVADSTEEIADVLITEWSNLSDILSSISSNIFQESSTLGDSIYTAIFGGVSEAMSKSTDIVALGGDLATQVYELSKAFISSEDIATIGSSVSNQIDFNQTLSNILGIMNEMKAEEERLKAYGQEISQAMLQLGGDLKELRPYLSIDFQTMTDQVAYYQEKFNEAWEEIQTDIYNSFKKGGAVQITKENLDEFNDALANYIASQQAAKDTTEYIADEFTKRWLSGVVTSEFDDISEYLVEEVKDMRNTLYSFFQEEDFDSALSSFGSTIGKTITDNIISKMLDTQKYKNALNTIYTNVDNMMNKGTSVTMTELYQLAQETQKYGLMLDQERQKIAAMTSLFDFDSEIVYDTTQDTINYQTSSSKESVYNVYQTNNFDIGNFVSTRATMEEFSEMIAPYMAKAFDNLGLN